MIVITRFILANTEQLHEKIKDMSDRIRQLEDALQQAYSQLSQAPHPLLSENLLQIKTSQELFGVGRDRDRSNLNIATIDEKDRRSGAASGGDDDDGPSGSSVPPGDLEDPNVRPYHTLVIRSHFPRLISASFISFCLSCCDVVLWHFFGISFPFWHPRLRLFVPHFDNVAFSILPWHLRRPPWRLSALTYEHSADLLARFALPLARRLFRLCRNLCISRACQMRLCG